MRIFVFVVLGVLRFAQAALAQVPAEDIVSPPINIQLRLMGGEFDGLETIAASERERRARYVGGNWAILDFYAVLARYNDPGQPCAAKSPFTFDEKRQAMEHWLAVKPESPTPRIALAHLWQQYAWTGRGCGYAGQTSEAQWRAFEERMQRALEYLRPVDPAFDPEVYNIALNAVVIDEHPREKLLSLYEKAVQAFSTVPDYAITRYHYLNPSWFGAPGEAAAFLDSLTTQPGGDAGLSLYFKASASALKYERDFTTLLAETGVKYPILAKAFAARAVEFGPMTYDMNIMLYYAAAARDFKTGDLLLSKIGDDWDPWLWGEKANFDSVAVWIRQWSVITYFTGK